MARRGGGTNSISLFTSYRSTFKPTAPPSSGHRRNNAAGDFTGTLGAAGNWIPAVSVSDTVGATLKARVGTSTTVVNKVSNWDYLTNYDDLYFDTHVVTTLRPTLRMIAGVDHLFGTARADSDPFDYSVPLSGRDAPAREALEFHPSTRLDDQRNFSGLYATAEWIPATRLRVDVGLRINHTRETREASDAKNRERDERSTTRGGGSVGVTWRAMQRGRNAISLFATYRNTFKPAAIDFGPEVEGEILKPEAAVSYEAGGGVALRAPPPAILLNASAPAF